MTQPEQNVGSSSFTRTDLETALLNRLQECLRASLRLDPSLARKDAGIGESPLGDAIRVAERALIEKVIISDAAMSSELDSRFSQVFSPTDSLRSMIDEHPHLVMEVSPRYNRTFLHTAVAADSESQVRKMLDHLNGRAMAHSINDHVKEKVSGRYTAYQVACVVGNYDGINDMIMDCLEESKKSIGISSSSSDQVEASDEEEESVEHPKMQLKRTLQMV